MSGFEYSRVVFGRDNFKTHGYSRRGILNGYKGAVFTKPDGEISAPADEIFAALGLETKVYQGRIVQPKIIHEGIVEDQLRRALMAIMEADIKQAKQHHGSRYARMIQLQWWHLCIEEGIEFSETTDIRQLFGLISDERHEAAALADLMPEVA